MRAVGPLRAPTALMGSATKLDTGSVRERGAEEIPSGLDYTDAREASTCGRIRLGVGEDLPASTRTPGRPEHRPAAWAGSTPD